MENVSKSKALKTVICFLLAIAVGVGGFFCGAYTEKKKHPAKAEEKTTEVTETATEPETEEPEESEEIEETTEAETDEETDEYDPRECYQGDYPEEGTGKIGEFLEAGTEDWYYLGVDTEDHESFLNMVTFWCPNFDCKKTDCLTTFCEMVVSVFGSSDIYDYYFGKNRKIYSSDKADPLKKYTEEPREYGALDPAYYVYDKDKIDWIIKNIFNVTPVKITDFKTEETYRHAYNYNDKYYVGFSTDSGSGYYYQPVRMDGCERMADGRYKVKVVMFLNDKIYDYATAVVGLKLIDGQRCWSLYSMECHYEG